MSDEPAVIDHDWDQQEAEYQSFLAKLDTLAPPEGKGLDLGRIQGRLDQRCAKAVILDYARKGWSRADLAELLSTPEWPITPRSVGRLLADALREAADDDDTELLRQFEISKLKMAEQFCHEMLKRGQEPTVTVKESLDKDGEVIELRTTHPPKPNPAWQKHLLEISKHLDKLQGLSKPTKVEIEKKEQKLVVNQVVVKTREEVNAAMAAGLLK